MAKPDYTPIFIVEDDVAYARVIRHSLENKNYANIKVFSSGEECIENLDLNPEIILLDYRLGEGKLNGLEVLKRIKKINPDIQIVFLTSVEKLEIATNTIKTGAYDYVVKSEAAMERIRNVIRRIIFENHIRKENVILKRSRRIILMVIFLLIAAIVVLGALQLRS